MNFEWFKPWYPVNDDSKDSEKMEAELRKELPEKHVLWGEKTKLIARAQDADDCLFLLEDGRVAEVHLTWSGKREPDAKWPQAVIHKNLEHWSKETNRRW
jgi:hypothetical protein